MIVEIDDKHLKDFFVNGRSPKINRKFQKNILLILDHLDGVTGPQDCLGVKDFHPLKGDRKGQYAMHVNGNYCVTFRFVGPDVHVIALEDYH